MGRTQPMKSQMLKTAGLLQRLEKWIPEGHLLHERSLRTARLLLMFYMASAAFLVVFATFYGCIGYMLGLWACLGGAMVVPILLWTFYRTGSLAVTTAVFDINAILMFSVLIYGTGGINSSIVPWLAIVPASGFVFQGWKRGLLMSIVCLVEIIVLFVLDLSGIHLPNLYDQDYRLHLNVVVQTGLLIYIFMILMIYQGSRDRTIRQLDELNAALHHRKAEVEQQREALEERNAQFIQLNAQLESTVASRTAKLALANKELDTFLYEAAHALRRPTARIMGLVSILKRETDPLVAGQMQGHVDVSAQLMDAILHKLVAVSELNSRPLHLEWLAISTVVDGAVQGMIYPNADAKPEWQVECDAAPEVLTDRFMLELALRYVLENAVQYSAKTGRQPTIHVGATQVGNDVELRITDNGIGIPASEIGRVTEMFFRATEKFPGGGLGLYVAQKAIDRLGGSIVLASELGVGTTVVMRLPVARY